jgi:GT2 family glycosyltransferase
MISVAVVILNFNGEKLLPQFLPSVIKHSQSANIFVVDNGSTDNSRSVLKTLFPQVKVISFEKNLGFSGGYNQALSQVNEDVVVLLNSDVEVTAGWLSSPVSLLSGNPTIVAVQPKILSFENKTHFEYAGAGGGFIDTLGYPFCRGRIFETIEKDDGQYNDQVPVFWASGACLFIKRKTYLAVGGLDEDFFAHMEEIDLCWRLHRAGHSIYYDGNSQVFHLGGGTLSSGNPRKTFLNFRNGLTLLAKNLPLNELIFKMPLRMVLDWAAAFNFLIHGQGRSFLAVLKAHFHFFLGIPKDVSKRVKWSQLGYRTSPDLILNKWIAVDYFLRGKRHFSEIKNPR